MQQALDCPENRCRSSKVRVRADAKENGEQCHRRRKGFEEVGGVGG